MVPALLSLVIQALLIVHCIKTGRSMIWIWVLLLLPIVGVLAYVVAELIPDLLRSRTTQKTVRGVRKALDPTADLRRLEGQARVTGGVGDQQRYAEELLRQGRAREAIEVYRQTLRGLYASDPNLMLGLAQAQFEAGEPVAARQTLDELIRLNPDVKSPQGHRLYARALEAEGAQDKALAEYAVLAGTIQGPRPRCAMRSYCAPPAAARKHARRCKGCSNRRGWLRPTISARRIFG
jgi:hypothetical protein